MCKEKQDECVCVWYEAKTEMQRTDNPQGKERQGKAKQSRVAWDESRKSYHEMGAPMLYSLEAAAWKASDPENRKVVGSISGGMVSF